MTADQKNMAETTQRLLAIVHTLATELNPRHIAANPVTLDSVLDRDLGLDSLSRLELLVRLERAFRIALPEPLLMSAETPRGLLPSILGDGWGAASTAAAAPGGAPGTLVEILHRRLSAHPDRPHISFYGDDGGGGRTVTYRELANGAAGIARGLRELGLKTGQPVMIMLPAGADYFFSFMAVLLAGGVPAPVDPPDHTGSLTEHLPRRVAVANHRRAEILITTPAAARFSQTLRDRMVNLRDVVTVRQLGPETTAWPGPQGPQPDDPALLQYASGEAGTHSVMFSHANLLANIRAAGTMLEITPDDVWVSWSPPYHPMGTWAWLASLYYAAHLVVLPPPAFTARPDRWLNAIHRYRGTLSAAPDYAYRMCLDDVDNDRLADLDLSRWRAALNGIEPASPETIERFTRRFAASGFRPEAMTPVYGMAENFAAMAMAPPRRPLIDHIDRDRLIETGRARPPGRNDCPVRRLAACGRPLPGHQIRIVDAAGLELADRQEGRIEFYGPSTDDHWLVTGDSGYIADGELYITARGEDAARPRLRRGWSMFASLLYAARCWSVFAPLAAAAWLLVMILPGENRRWAVTRSAARGVLRLCAIPVTLQGSENMPTGGAPCIFISNHQSYIDAFVMFAVLPHRANFVAKSELLKNFFLSRPLRRLGIQFVERFDTAKSVAAARRITELGGDGRSLMFFAEGTFTRAPGLLPFRLGAFGTAATTGLPIIPLAIRGARSVLRDGPLLPRRGAINVIAGPAIRTEEQGFMAAVELRQRTRRWILEHCSEPDLAHERGPANLNRERPGKLN